MLYFICDSRSRRLEVFLCFFFFLRISSDDVEYKLSFNRSTGFRIFESIRISIKKRKLEQKMAGDLRQETKPLN